MAKKILTLSEEEAEILRRIIRDIKQNPRPQARYREEREIGPAPEVYIARTPAAGIAASTEEPGTGTGSGSGIGGQGKLSYADCEVYRKTVLYGYSELVPVGITRRVFNVSTTAIPGDEWVVIERDKFGTWVPIKPMSAGGGEWGLTSSGILTTDTQTGAGNKIIRDGYWGATQSSKNYESRQLSSSLRFSGADDGAVPVSILGHATAATSPDFVWGGFSVGSTLDDLFGQADYSDTQLDILPSNTTGRLLNDSGTSVAVISGKAGASNIYVDAAFAVVDNTGTMFVGAYTTVNGLVFKGGLLISGTLTLTYTPGNSADWNGDPTTYDEAIDRLAAAVAGLLGGAIP